MRRWPRHLVNQVLHAQGSIHRPLFSSAGKTIIIIILTEEIHAPNGKKRGGKKENKKIKTLTGFIVRVYFLYNFFDPTVSYLAPFRGRFKEG